MKAWLDKTFFEKLLFEYPIDYCPNIVYDWGVTYGCGEEYIIISQLLFQAIKNDSRFIDHLWGTILHEMVHAKMFICYKYNRKLTHDNIKHGKNYRFYLNEIKLEAIKLGFTWNLTWKRDSFIPEELYIHVQINCRQNELKEKKKGKQNKENINSNPNKSKMKKSKR